MTEPTARRVLDTVPRSAFYAGGPRFPEDLPSAMRALMEFLGRKEFGCRACGWIGPGSVDSRAKACFVGMTGLDSCLSWKPGWQGDNLIPDGLPGEPGDADRRVSRACADTRL
jgi:hypothetical protein